MSPARTLVVEADGGSRGNPGPASYGALVRDPASGEILLERAEHIGVASNNVAEYRGLIAGLELARQLDPQARVEVRMDSKLAVEQMSGRWKIKHPDMAALAQRARAIAPVGGVSFTWVPRERNKDADRLANEALDAAAAGRRWSPRESAAPSTSAAPDVLAEPAQPALLKEFTGSTGEPTTLVLLRHGVTDETLAKRFSGAGADPDPALSDEGRRQAAGAAVAAAARGDITAVVSSPLRRARETAELAAAALGLPVTEVPDLREADFGAWEGLTFAEVAAGWPVELQAWLDGPDAAPPGGESRTALARRVRTAKERLVARHPGATVLVVSHVTPMTALICAALGAPDASSFRLELEPASTSELRWWPDGGSSVRSLNLGAPEVSR